MKKITYLSATALLFCIACNNSVKDKKTENISDTSFNTSDSLLTKNENSKAIDATSASFFENAANNSLSFMEASNKILQSTKDVKVSAMANAILDDLKNYGGQLNKIANPKGYNIPTTLTKKKLALIDKMTEFKNEAKDEYYLKLMLQFQDNQIGIYALASRSEDKVIANFAKANLPILNKRYQELKTLDSLLQLPKANQGDDILKISDRKKQ